MYLKPFLFQDVMILSLNLVQFENHKPQLVISSWVGKMHSSKFAKARNTSFQKVLRVTFATFLIDFEFLSHKQLFPDIVSLNSKDQSCLLIISFFTQLTLSAEMYSSISIIPCPPAVTWRHRLFRLILSVFPFHINVKSSFFSSLMNLGGGFGRAVRL